MYACDIYVADLAASTRANAAGDGAPPTEWAYPLSPAFPPVDSPLAVLNHLVGKIESGQLHGRQVDQDCWVAVMTPGEIIGYIDEVYDLCWYRGLGSREHLNQQLNYLLEALIRLDPYQRYALVAHRGGGAGIATNVIGA